MFINKYRWTDVDVQVMPGCFRSDLKYGAVELNLNRDGVKSIIEAIKVELAGISPLK